MKKESKENINDIKIRKANIKDIDQLIEIEKEFDSDDDNSDFEKMYGRIKNIRPEGDYYKNCFLEYFEDSKKAAGFVCIKDKKIIGFVFYTFINKRPVERYKVKKLLFLDSIFVTKKYRSLGIGKVLYSEVEKVCLKNKLNFIGLSVLKENKKALKLYKNLGFKEERIRMTKQIK
jgi:ribosomal protein S18 acetylase RimI-like enzyme